MDLDWESGRTISKHPEQSHLEDALVEARRWIENVTGRRFQYDNFRKSMTDGILLCMLMQKIKPGLIKKINKSRSIYAGVDNLNVFLGACEELGLKAAQLFHPGDLQDLSSRASLSIQDRKREEERRLKSVCITIFWLGRTANQLDSYTGPHLNLDAFAPLIHGSTSLVKGFSPDNASSGVSSWASGASTNNNRRSSLGYNDDVFTSDGIDLTSVAPETYSEPKWKRDLKRELDSAVPGLSEYTDLTNTKPVLRMDSSRRRPPPVAAKPLHSRSRSMPERSAMERQNSVEDDDSQSYRSGSSGDPTSPTTYDEFVKSKGMLQEDQEVWMSMADAATSVVSIQRSLDSWKSRRRRATHSALERKASREEVEQTEQSRQRRRSKTYQEMMEEKEKREKILMKMTTKHKTLEAEDIVHILTKPSLYEDEIQDLPEHRPRSKSLTVDYREGGLISPSFDTTNSPPDSTDAPPISRQPPPRVTPKPKVRRSGVGSAFAPYQRTDSRGSNNGEEMIRSSQRRDDHAAPPMTFREKLLRDREREIGMSAAQRNTKSSARLPQKKRLSLGIMGRVAAFNKGEVEEEHKPKPQPPREAPKLEPEYTEHTIHMKQRPRNEEGFGFTIIGGADSGRSIVVTSITPGSTAEKCELKVGDEIVTINGEKTKLVTYDHAMYSFSSAILDGELTLKIHRYDTLRTRMRSSTQNTEQTHGKVGPPVLPKRRAVSQPSDPQALSQAARARKILEQAREEEKRIEDMRREREEERMRPTVNGNRNWNHSENMQEPTRSYYNEPEPQEQPLGDAIPSGSAAPSLPEPKDSTPFRDLEKSETDQKEPSVIEAEVKQEVKEMKPLAQSDLFANLERNSPDREQYGNPVEVGFEVVGGEMSPGRDTVSPDAGIVLDDETKEDMDDKYPDGGIYSKQVEVGVEVISAEENLTKSETVQEQSVNLWKLLESDPVDAPKSNLPTQEGGHTEHAGPDGDTVKGSPYDKSSRPEDVASDGEMFSSEEEERMEAEIMRRMEAEEQAEEEAEARHRRIEEDERDKSPIHEDFIAPQSKQAEEAPISFKHFTLDESAPPKSSAEDPPPPHQHPTTTIDSSKPPKYHPVKFSSGPKPFTNRLGPEPYKPPSFKPVSVPDAKPDIKQDMMKRRSDFFSKPPEPGLLPVFGYSDDDRERNRSGQSSPVIGVSVTAERQHPTEAAVEPTEGAVEPQVQQPVESSVPVTQPKQPVALSTRKAFNMEEEKKRLERWHAEQERIRQEQYEQEQRRLREQQEKDLEKAESEERRRKMEEHQRLLEKQKMLQEQAMEERRRLEEERKERVRREQEYLEQARLEREAAERERLRDEEEQQKLAAERKQREEERMRREEEERERKEAERRAEEEAQREREEEERLQLELERQEQEAEARRLEINRIREKEAEERARRKREQEARKREEEARKREEEARRAQEQEQEEKERFARLREEEIERIRAEEREKLRKEWEELQREKAKQEERERMELERLEQLRAEQERLRQERLKLEQQQEEERRQLLREKERLMAQSENSQPAPEKIPYNKPDDAPNSKEPRIAEKDSHIQEYSKPVQEKEIIMSQEVKDVYSAPPTMSNNQESYKVPGQSYMSQYKDGRMATQHWLVEEAERRRLAEKNGTSRLQEPAQAHTGPILRKDLDLEPVLEKKTHAPEHAAPVRHPNKPQPIQEPVSSKPLNRDREVPHQPPPHQDTRDQGYREVAVDVPPDFQPAPRRPRAQEAEADRKRKAQNRQSMPDMGNRVPDVVRNDTYTPPPGGSDRNSGRIPDSVMQTVISRAAQKEAEAHMMTDPTGQEDDPNSAVYVTSSSETEPREQTSEYGPPNSTAKTATATMQDLSSPKSDEEEDA